MSIEFYFFVGILLILGAGAVWLNHVIGRKAVAELKMHETEKVNDTLKRNEEIANRPADNDISKLVRRL